MWLDKVTFALKNRGGKILKIRKSMFIGMLIGDMSVFMLGACADENVAEVKW